MPHALRSRVARTLELPSAPDDKLGRASDLFITTLIVLNVTAVVLETVPSIHTPYRPWFLGFEMLSLALFSLEYAGRLWTAVEDPQFSHPVKGRLRWMTTPYAVIDLLAILPALLFVVDLRFVRVLRLLRLLKLGRYSRSMQVLGRVMHKRREELVMSLFLVMMALLLVSSFVYYAEREVQPEAFGSIPAAFWWGINALTTVGYGDVAPVTLVGRTLGGVAALLGVGLIALPVGILASGFVEEMRQADQAAPMLCPHCGEDTGARP